VGHKQVHWISLLFVSLPFYLSHLEICCVLNSRLLHSVIYQSTGRVVINLVLRCIEKEGMWTEKLLLPGQNSVQVLSFLSQRLRFNIGVLVCGLLSDVVSTLDCQASHCRAIVINEFEEMWNCTWPNLKVHLAFISRD
jgi:hypothetical protein